MSGAISGPKFCSSKFVHVPTAFKAEYEFVKAFLGSQSFGTVGRHFQ